MAWFKFGRAKSVEATVPGKTAALSTPVATDGECPHAALVPRWDNAADIGHADRASHFLCDACKAKFTPDEAAALQHREAERLRSLLEA